MLKDVCSGAMSIFTSLLAIFVTANFLPKDLEDRTLYNSVKPVPRFVYLLGKLLGIILLLALFTLLMRSSRRGAWGAGTKCGSRNACGNSRCA